MARRSRTNIQEAPDVIDVPEANDHDVPVVPIVRDGDVDGDHDDRVDDDDRDGHDDRVDNDDRDDDDERVDHTGAPSAVGGRGAVGTIDLEPAPVSSFAGLDSGSAPASAAPEKPPRGWTDPVVLVLIAVAVAGFAFAAGRFTKESGPKSLQEAQAMVQAGTLPATTGGATGTAGAGAAGARGQNGYGGAGGFTPPAGAGNFTPPAGMGAPPAG